MSVQCAEKLAKSGDPQSEEKPSDIPEPTSSRLQKSGFLSQPVDDTALASNLLDAFKVTAHHSNMKPRLKDRNGQQADTSGSPRPRQPYDPSKPFTKNRTVVETRSSM